MSSLAGNSRSGGTTNWIHYVASKYDASVIYSLERKGQLVLFDISLDKELKKLSPSDKLKILDTKLTKKGASNYAKVSVGKKIGLLNINAITKPTGRSKDSASVIGGGKNSKEFTPDKFNLGGSEFKNLGALVSTVANRLQSVYGGEEYAEIRRYLNHVVQKVTGIKMLSEKLKRFSQSYKTDKFAVTDSDMKIISKNFGEIVGAMFLLRTNKKAAVVGFPGAVNEGLYDIYTKDDKGRMHYYSAKSAGGSSTSMANLNFIRRNFSSGNTWVQQHMKELETIDALINTTEYNTVYNITAFFNDELPIKVKAIVKVLNGLSMPELQIRDVEQETLDDWFISIKETRTEKQFVDTMMNIYNNVLGDVKGTPKTSDKVLREMFNGKSSFHHGYLLYPMGSYIVKYLNNSPTMVEALNLLAGFANYISQITVDMSTTNTEVQIIKFAKNDFRFSYNGMSKAPGNRPIGFKEA